ncbi:MAG: regulatory protein RecX [Bacteriovorax sp.]|nr:regulatory protein RecX [Bacteriovorax sp.]
MITPSSKAYTYLVKIISSRDYSEHKLREKLREKNHPAEEIDSAINEIKARGFLREEVYAEARVKGFMDRGYSPDYIRQRLAQEHLTVTDAEIEAVFTEYRLTPKDQIDRLIRKKIQGKTEFDYAGENKILRYLLSKGHDFGDAKKVLKSIIGEVASQAE